MNDKAGTKPIKWRDPAGNVYGVEKAVRNGRYIVIRTNPGGNRKAARQFNLAGSVTHVQQGLDAQAKAEGWTEVG